MSDAISQPSHCLRHEKKKKFKKHTEKTFITETYKEKRFQKKKKNVVELMTNHFIFIKKNLSTNNSFATIGAVHNDANKE